MTLAAPLYHTQPQGRQTSLSQAWQFGLLLLALWVWGLMAGGGGMGSTPTSAVARWPRPTPAATWVWKENHSAYGEQQLEVSQAQMQWFLGKEADAATGLPYFGARYYDPAMGRFMGAIRWVFSSIACSAITAVRMGYNYPARIGVNRARI